MNVEDYTIEEISEEYNNIIRRIVPYHWIKDHKKSYKTKEKAIDLYKSIRKIEVIVFELYRRDRRNIANKINKKLTEFYKIDKVKEYLVKKHPRINKGWIGE